MQEVNPKAWAVALTAATACAPIPGLPGVVRVAVTVGMVNLPSAGPLQAPGRQLGHLVSNPARLRAVNVALAMLLPAPIAPVLVA